MWKLTKHSDFWFLGLYRANRKALLSTFGVVVCHGEIDHFRPTLGPGRRAIREHTTFVTVQTPESSQNLSQPGEESAFFNFISFTIQRSKEALLAHEILLLCKALNVYHNLKCKFGETMEAFHCFIILSSKFEP